MQIKFNNPLQVHIADLLWEADSNNIDKILSIYGKDAHVVYHMLLAESFDLFNDTDIAFEVLKNIFEG